MANSRSVGAISARQALFFVLAIVVPCALLVVLTVRMLVQERELADQRIADERVRIAADVRQELLSHLERLRLEAAAAEPLPQVALVAQVDGGRLVMPWERDPAPGAAALALEQPTFREAVREGERQEYIEARFAAAADAYRRAAAGPGATDLHRAAAHLHAARALTKGRRTTDAIGLYRRVLAASHQLVDDQGIPLVLYAARRLLDGATVTETDVAAIITAIEGVLSGAWVRPASLYMASDIAARLDPPPGALKVRTTTLREQLRGRTADLEQALELQKGFSAPAPVRPDGGDATWVLFGAETNRWLVSYSSRGGTAAVVALRADPVLRGVETSPRFAALGPSAVRISASADGDPLLPNFPDLRASIAPGATAALAREVTVRRPFYVAALAAVLSTALFGAYLFWRDVGREIRLAEMRSQFVSSVSHELKTPLTAIRMFAETLLLGRAVRPDTSHEYLETIVQESERLTRLLNNVLDFSKIEQGTKTYRLERHSPAAMVRTAGKAMQYPLAQQGFDLHVTVDDGVPAIAADPDAIQQAILNLLSNAMKYSGAGRIITLELKRNGGSAIISVTDQGIGIPAAEHARIFQKFYRVPGSDNQRIAGTGLGLTLVDHVARAHGGRVSVRSAPGEGSTFSLHLPLADEGAPNEAQALA